MAPGIGLGSHRNHGLRLLLGPLLSPCEEAQGGQLSGVAEAWLDGQGPSCS